MNITVAGIGYVGLSISILLAQNNKVKAYDINKERIEMINKKISPLEDKDIIYYLSNVTLDLEATDNGDYAFSNAEIIVIATPTNYDPVKNFFDTTSIESTLENILVLNKKALIIIKSTIPVGYVRKLREKYNTDKIIFSPEFLREGRALYDNLYPSRIIIGDKSEKGVCFASLLKQGAIKNDIPILYVEPDAAESIKLFSNTYLAMRVAFFNELDIYAETLKIDSSDIIKGVCLDPRIGNFYNNPSFGYGGYCLPKDTKQLLANFDNIPNALIKAVVESNNIRKNYIVSHLTLNVKDLQTVGVYRLIMKSGSDNFRESAIQDIITGLQNKNIKIIVYEPTLKLHDVYGLEIIHDLEDFKNNSDIILANRYSNELANVKSKVYTRDIFYRD